MDINTVKSYLRIDYDDDDELIGLFMNMAEQYIHDAVGDIEMDNYKVQLVFLAIVRELYDNRSMVTTADREQKMTYMVRSIITQLQVEALK